MDEDKDYDKLPWDVDDDGQLELDFEENADGQE